MSPIAMSSETNVSATLSGDTETRFSVVAKSLAPLEASALCQHQVYPNKREEKGRTIKLEAKGKGDES